MDLARAEETTSALFFISELIETMLAIPTALETFDEYCPQTRRGNRVKANAWACAAKIIYAGKGYELSTRNKPLQLDKMPAVHSL